MSARRLNPSIDEMARDAFAIAGKDAWRGTFETMLHCYGYRVKREGGVIFSGDVPVQLCSWDIVKAA